MNRVGLPQLFPTPSWHEYKGIMKKVILAIWLTLGLSFPAGGAELKFNTQDFPPFNYQIEETVSGPIADIIRAICGEMKIRCSFDLLPWRRARYEVRTGQADAFFVVGWNKERSEWLYFSQPLLETQYGFFVHKDTPLQYQSPSDIAGSEVGVFGPSNTANALKKLQTRMIESKLPPIRVHMTHDDVLVFRMLDRGDRGIDSVYSNRDVGMAIIHQDLLKNIRYAGTHTRLKYYIGFSKKHTDKQLVDDFNETFKQLHKAGVIQKILADYHMEAVELE